MRTEAIIRAVAALCRRVLTREPACSPPSCVCGHVDGLVQNGGVMPLNKNLWSPSFIFVMAGTGFLMLSLTYILVDVTKWWTGAPFRFVGMNSIIVYFGSEVFHVRVPACGCPVWALWSIIAILSMYSLPLVVAFSSRGQGYFPFSFMDHAQSDGYGGRCVTSALD